MLYHGYKYQQRRNYHQKHKKHRFSKKSKGKTAVCAPPTALTPQGVGYSPRIAKKGGVGYKGVHPPQNRLLRKVVSTYFTYAPA